MKKNLGNIVCLLSLIVGRAVEASEPRWPFEVTDLRDRTRLVILVFGDGGTGKAGQHRVGKAMDEVCRKRGCDLALMLGDNIYENGIEVRNRSDAEAGYREILAQFEEKFERPYRALGSIPGFLVWGVLGNHDYRRNAVGAMVTYSEVSQFWRVPGLHYEVPLLPEWIQIYALHTDTHSRRDLNGLQVAAASRALCRGDDRWKIVFGHQPVRNSGHHRADASEMRTRALLEPLFRECGIDLYLSGHAHHQEHLTARGFEQVIQGAAGKSKGRNRPAEDVRQRHFSKSFGFAVVEVDPSRIRMDFYDVLNTREKGEAFTPPATEEIVLAYSWCATKEEIGRPDLDTVCPQAAPDLSRKFTAH